jgi:uncharacterized membrane protein YfcA
MAVVAAAFLAGGLFKGVVGIGLPAVALPILMLCFGLPPAVGLMCVPTLVSNLVQLNAGGFAPEATRRFAWLLVALAIATVAGARLMTGLDRSTALALVGAVSLLFCATQLVRIDWRVSPEAERWASPIVGAVAGLLGGATSAFGPPLVIYMLMLRLPRDAFIASLSQIYLVATVVLYLALGTFGALGWPLLLASAAAAFPAWLGVEAGRRWRERIPEAWHRPVVVVTLSVIGLDLLRRSLLPS